MSIFPDDDPRRQRDESLIDGERRKASGAPTPNAPNAFEGGAIRQPGGSRRSDPKLSRPQYKPQIARPSSRNWLGCLIALVIIGAVVLPIFFFVIGPTVGLFNLFGEDTRTVPGSETAFDPIATYDEIAAYAQGEAESVEFIEMTASYVRRDGTMDLTASYRPRVVWTFVIPAPRPENAPPIGAGGSRDDRYYQEVDIEAFQPGQMRTVTTTGGGTSSSYTYRHLGLSREVDSPTNRRRDATPPPACSFKTLWDAAIRHDAPPEAVAIIIYSRGEYVFNISDTNIRLRFDAQCNEIR